MGFDLSGLNPNLARPMPGLPQLKDRTDEDWETYNKWQDETVVHTLETTYGGGNRYGNLLLLHVK